MKIKNLDYGRLEAVIRRLRRSGYIEDDGNNYIIPKRIFKAALNDPINAQNAPVDAQDDVPAVLTLIELLKRFKELYRAAFKAPYKPESSDWALLRRTARKFGVGECGLRIEQYFGEESVHGPSIKGFDRFMSRQRTLGNIK